MADEAASSCAALQGRRRGRGAVGAVGRRFFGSTMLAPPGGAAGWERRRERWLRGEVRVDSEGRLPRSDFSFLEPALVEKRVLETGARGCFSIEKKKRLTYATSQPVIL